MSHLFWLDQVYLKRIQHLFPKPCGVSEQFGKSSVGALFLEHFTATRNREGFP